VVDGMDQAIMQVLNTLDEEQIAEQTLVFFMSDNGGAAYAYGGADNAPLRGGKSEVYEGGIRVVSLLRWPGVVPAGSRFDSIMTVMDLFPTLAEAASVPVAATKPLDGRSLWQSIVTQQRAPRQELIFFASETPIYGEFNFTAFNDDWKLIQRVIQDPLQISVSNQLFAIGNDPYEYQDLAEQDPLVVERLAAAIASWRAQYPINGTRSRLAPPPGWRAPLDWASYPRPLEQLQPNAAPSYAPNPAIERALDRQHGERGRLIYR
jgi:arylsulfatase A-like enzyme